MQPVTEITEEHLAYWSEEGTGSVVPPQVRIFTAPDDPADAIPCPGILTWPDGIDRPAVVRVAWEPTEEDVRAICAGKTIWLSCWGGLPAHSIEVEPVEVFNPLDLLPPEDFEADWSPALPEPPALEDA